MAVEGFEIPIHRSLTEPLLILGVPREIAILNICAFGIFFAILQFWWILPLNFLIHSVFVVATKKDPQISDTFKRYTKKKNYYST